VALEPAPPDPGRDNDPARHGGDPGDPFYDRTGQWRLLPSGTDWMDDEAWAARRASLADEVEPEDPELEEDPDCRPPPGLDDAQLAALVAEARELTAEEDAAAVRAARLGATGTLAAIAADRRGPGMPGSAKTFPGELASPAAGFAAGQALDTAAGCAVLALFAADVAGDRDRYPGATDDELLGVIAAWDRVEAHASGRKHAAVAELIRRRPAAGCPPAGPAQMPAGWDESAIAELAAVLGLSRRTAEGVLRLAEDLEVLLPGTRAAFRAGILSRYRAEIIAAATQLLDPADARAAEALVLGRAGTLTPGGLRAAIARAVMEVAPDKARKRREEAARDARVERWAEASGNASLAGRELPPAQVLAADQRVTWWAQQLKAAGLDGGMDELRARSYLDILLGIDSRPQAGRTGRDGSTGDGSDGGSLDGGGPDGPRDGGSGPAGSGGPGGVPARGGPLAGVVPPGFAGRVTLTVPLATLLGLADRPGEIPGIGPVDPDHEANTTDRYRAETCADRHGGSGIWSGGPRSGCAGRSAPLRATSWPSSQPRPSFWPRPASGPPPPPSSLPQPRAGPSSCRPGLGRRPGRHDPALVGRGGVPVRRRPAPWSARARRC
jgi:Domain of unknown function (DUF222)